MPDELTDAPWSKDLESAFADPEIRAQVDAYLRNTVQPHVTKLEQSSRDALALYNDLTNPETAAQAYVSISQELFGDEAADRLIASLNLDVDEDESTEEEPDDLEAMKAEWLAEKQAKAYREALDELKQAKGLGDEFVEDLFHPFVASAGGDLEAAYAQYENYYDRFKSMFGEPKLSDEVPVPPPTLGSAPASAPTQKQYTSTRAAIDDMFADMAAGPPPTIGAV